MAILRGNNSANWLYGTGDDDVIYGFGGNDVLYGRGGADQIYASSGNDRIYGGAGADKIHAGSGNDRIVGGAGSDTIWSGTGADTIVYKSVSDSRYDVNFTKTDWIRDWEPADTIDLSAIDANTTMSGNQAFTFAGYSFGVPSGPLEAGELSIGGFGGELYIIANTDADEDYELAIALWSQQGEAGLTVGDIVL